VLETADEYFDHDRKYHGMWKMYGLDLPDEVLRKLYYKNACGSFQDSARRDSRQIERSATCQLLAGPSLTAGW
jgi:hypothetical protein